jgi:hypothetical protein
MNAYRILMGKPEGKRPLEKTRHRWENNIKIDLRVIGWGGVDWLDLTQNRDQWRALVNSVMNQWVPRSHSITPELLEREAHLNLMPRLRMLGELRAHGVLRKYGDNITFLSLLLYYIIIKLLRHDT